MKPDPVPLVVDSREQLAYVWTADVATVTVAKLEAGDYSVAGCESRWAVERKTLGDYLGSVTHDRARFTRELERLRSYEFACVVVEAHWDDVIVGNYRSAAHPESIVGTTASIFTRYCPIFFAGDRDGAQRFVLRVLRRLWLDGGAL